MFAKLEPSQLSREVLRAGLDDWVPLAAVAGLARQLGASNDAETIDISLAAIRELVKQGLVVIGEVSDGGFFPWTEPLEDALTRMKIAWRTLDRDQWGFICWLSNTPAGDAQARRHNAAHG